MAMPVGDRRGQLLALVVRSPEGPAVLRSTPVPLRAADRGRAVLVTRPVRSTAVERSEASPTTAASAPAARGAPRHALRRPHNWIQLAKFCVVGASGYVVNLVVYSLLLEGRASTTCPPRSCSFLVAVTNNYIWNRHWTFRGQRGHVAYQGMRFLVVSLLALGANLVVLRVLVGARRRGRSSRRRSRSCS